MGLHQGRKPQFAGQALQGIQLLFVQDGRDQQYGIRADDLRLIDLIGIDDEIFPDDRKRYCLFYLRQEAIFALEKIGLRQYR